MNYGITNPKEWGNKKNLQVVSWWFSWLKNQIATNLTVEKTIEHKVLSEEVKRMLSKLWIYQVEVLKNKLDHIVVRVDGREKNIPIHDNVINDVIFIQKEPWLYRYNIMKSWDVTDSIHFAKALLERERIVNEWYEKSKWATWREDKTLFNNLVQSYYINSNKTSHFNTVIQWETLIWKIEDTKELNDHEILITVRFNKNFFWKIKREKAAARWYAWDARDLHFKEWDCCFVKVKRLREEEKNWNIVRSVDLQYYY